MVFWSTLIILGINIKSDLTTLFILNNTKFLIVKQLCWNSFKNSNWAFRMILVIFRILQMSAQEINCFLSVELTQLKWLTSFTTSFGEQILMASSYRMKGLFLGAVFNKLFISLYQCFILPHFADKPLRARVYYLIILIRVLNFSENVFKIIINLFRSKLCNIAHISRTRNLNEYIIES